METTTLRYFLHVAKLENIHKASKKAHVSPSTLSKALAKLEEELQVKLFKRHGRNIKLTDQGRFLQTRATEIIDLEEATKSKLLGVESTIHITLCGQEILLSQKGVDVGLHIRKTFPRASLEFIPTDTDQHACQAVEFGHAHMAIVMQRPPTGLFSVHIGEVRFVTCVGPGHALYERALNNAPVSIKEVVQYPFASPMPQVSNQKESKHSADGWRDDKNPREIRFVSKSLNTLEKLVKSGQALAYLPDYFASKLHVKVVNIVDCPHSCKQKINLVTRDPSRFGWLNQVSEADPQ